MVLVVRNADLIREVSHRGADTGSDSSNNQTVDIINVGDPSMGLSVWLDVLEGVFEEFVDLPPVVLGVLETGNDEGLMALLDILRSQRLWLSLEEWLLPRLHHLLDLANVGLHLLDEGIHVSDDTHAGADEWIDVLSVPSEFANARSQCVVHLRDPVLQ